MAKNIVVCCDGTGNEYGHNRTNVLKLYSALDLSSKTQVGFYDPGVGTFSLKPMMTKPGVLFQKSLGLAFGAGLRVNVIEAYRFLVNTFEAGDRIFIFGFSRGAYTARVVAALIKGTGILRPEFANLIPYALRYIEAPRDKPDWKRLRGFRKRFAIATNPDQVFVGVWDTVSSVSWLWDRLYYLYTHKNEAVDIVRHAVSIDERRAFFRTNLLHPAVDGQDFKEVWFSGVHCDVGGGNPDEKSGLSQLALEWMLVEAREKGLLVDTAKAQHELERGSGPDPKAAVNPSLKGWWWLCEGVPRLSYNRGVWGVRINFARRRPMKGEVTVHQSVDIRMKSGSDVPGNLPTEFKIEPWVPFS